jgi:hypothetical protein
MDTFEQITPPRTFFGEQLGFPNETTADLNVNGSIPTTASVNPDGPVASMVAPVDDGPVASMVLPIAPVDNHTAGDIELSKDVQEPEGRGQRKRKAATKDIGVPLTISAAGLKWLDEPKVYLLDKEIDMDLWNDCVGDWLKFEKQNSIANLSAVS